MRTASGGRTTFRVDSAALLANKSLQCGRCLLPRMSMLPEYDDQIILNILMLFRLDDVQELVEYSNASSEVFKINSC